MVRSKGQVFTPAQRLHQKRYMKKRARENKARLIALFGGKCSDCGITGHPAIFDFDHIDPKTKRCGIAKLGGANWETIMKEAVKCRMVCANCHRVRTYGYALDSE